MRRTLIGASALLAALLAAAPAAAQLTAINETRRLPAGTAIEIEVISHSLVVEGWDRDEIQIVGEYDPSVEELDIRSEDGTYVFEIDQPDRGFRRRTRGGSEGQLRIQLPRGARVDLETVSGSVRVSGVAGALQASSVSGRVDVTGNLQSAELSAVSGGVTYRGDAPIVRLESVSGSVDFTGTGRNVELEAVSGSVTMNGGAETLDAESVSGSIRVVSSTAVRALDASSVSGGVDFRGPLASGARVDLESHSGTVDVQVVGRIAAEFDLETFSGDLDVQLTDMRDVVSNRSRRTSSESMRFVTGSGAGRVSVSSFSGNVRITETR